MAKTTKPQGARPGAKAPSKKKTAGKPGDSLKARQAAAGPARQPGVERRKNHPLRAKNGHIHVLLTQPVPHLGQPGDLVHVRPGFARNYLLPQGLAIFATQHNLLILEKHRQRLKKQEEAHRADLQSLGAQIAQRSLTIEANANEEGHLYGSVNADQIAAALKSEGFPIETEAVRIEGPLKDLGLYTIKIHLAQDIVTEVKLWVVPTHTDESVPSA
jgi:large subunit ribosomal protein L9